MGRRLIDRPSQAEIVKTKSLMAERLGLTPSWGMKHISDKAAACSIEYDRKVAEMMEAEYFKSDEYKDSLFPLAPEEVHGFQVPAVTRHQLDAYSRDHGYDGWEAVLYIRMEELEKVYDKFLDWKRRKREAAGFKVVK